MEPETYLAQLYSLLLQYGPRILSAVVILGVGLWVIRRVSHSFDTLLRKRHIDDSLRPFFTSLVDVALKVALLLVVAGQAGIETTSFIAVFSAVAFAVGLALQGSLGNFASGVLILLFRPYRVGDLVEVDGHLGYVVEIQIFNTVLSTDQAHRIIIPNSKMTEGSIKNIAKGTEVQVEISVLLDSATPLPLLREAVDAAAQRCAWLLPHRPPEVVIMGISRDDLKADIGWWTLGEHYIETLDAIHEALHAEFEAHGIRLAKERRREVID